MQYSSYSIFCIQLSQYYKGAKRIFRQAGHCKENGNEKISCSSFIILSWKYDIIFDLSCQDFSTLKPYSIWIFCKKFFSQIAKYHTETIDDFKKKSPPLFRLWEKGGIIILYLIKPIL